ncbi:MAG: hypothetical protein CR217_09550 [Beijerinckiaceae bacterium]|nr:MAG: hypothetical protein CR217_09550 [Beijerinckiaceae bacterium]
MIEIEGKMFANLSSKTDEHVETSRLRVCLAVSNECALKLLPQWTTSISESQIYGVLQCLRE